MRRTNTTINTTTPFVTSYSYKDHATDYNRTSTQLQSISYSNNKGFKYTYDANGNITSIRDINNNIIAEYEYDALNQLVGEYNSYLNKTYTYIYDNGGNIIDVIEYNHATGLSIQKTYTYGDSQWRDLLTNYNGASLTYDTIGNPLNWINGEQFTWSGGRKLTGITKGNNVISYAYNDSGIRTSKTVNNVRTDYYLNGTAIIMQKTGDNCIWYTYDENGLVTGFRYNGAEYYYFRNAQNDIIGIVNSSGSVVANYTYDSWGNHIAITDGNGNNVANNPNHIANINPFRYRGYYYDVETGLYYLNSRYYDANVGRFLNADSQLATNDVSGMNLFAYCGNNPIARTDTSGQAWWHWALGAAVVVACAVATVVTCGGFAAAACAVSAVSCGIAATTTASTIAAGAFIASASTFGYTVLSAASSSDSIEEFCDKGSWNTVIDTIMNAFFGSVYGYSLTQNSSDVTGVNNSNTQSNKTSIQTTTADNRFNDNQTAVIKIAKEYKKTGMGKSDANILWGWAEEYGLSSRNNFHGPKYDSYLGGSQYHIKINGMHINIFD